MSFAWKCFAYSFKFLCFGGAFSLMVWCVYNFSLNEDATTISFKEFYSKPNDVYPSASICISSPFEQKKLVESYGNDITLSNYSRFLEGEFWSDDMMKIDYDSVLLKPIDYVLGYRIGYRNATEIHKSFSLKNQDKNGTGILPTIRVATPSMICFGIDIQLHKDITDFSYKIDTSIFEHGIRPKTFKRLMPRSLMVIVHYPNQIFRSSWKIQHWQIRSENSSKNYEIAIDVRGMEVMRLRNKLQQGCIDGFPNYDHDILQDILLSDDVSCRPPYAVSPQNLSLCTNQQKMKLIKDHQFSHWSGVNLKHQPCSGMEKVNYEVNESDEKETEPPYFTITFKYKELTYKEIRMKRAYDFQALVGTIGGYIGLFLGYALIMVPEFLKTIISKITLS